MSNNLPSIPAKVPFLSNAQYDKMKFLAQVVLPALATFYAAVAVFWGLPKPTEVVGTVVAVDTLLGLLLGLSSKTYAAQEPAYDGELQYVAHDSSLLLPLEIYTPPEDLVKKDSVVFKVSPRHVKPYEGNYPEDKFA